MVSALEELFSGGFVDDHGNCVDIIPNPPQIQESSNPQPSSKPSKSVGGKQSLSQGPNNMLGKKDKTVDGG